MRERSKNSGEAWQPSLRYRLANSQLGRAVMATMMLPLGPVTDPVERSSVEYPALALPEQTDIRIMSANLHHRPLTQYFNSEFKEQNPLSLIESYPEIDIACFQEISEEDAHSLSEHGDVVFAVNNEYPLNGKVGVALFSRRKISDASRPNLSHGSRRPAILATIDNLRFACLHFTNNEVSASNELNELLEIAEGLDVVAGDFNLQTYYVGNSAPKPIASSESSGPTLGSRTIDRIILLAGSEITISHVYIKTELINSDHRAVIMVIIPSRRDRVDMQELKGSGILSRIMNKALELSDDNFTLAI